ncbi:MAG TPA: AI-2E family transporter [Patescibacteria group bacterium]|nr:AI-2E family transporter [Patescibacteria group bacterium]
MAVPVQHSQPLKATVRFSFVFMAGLFLLMVLLRLGTPLVAALFTFLALERLTLARRGGKWIAIGAFMVLFLAGAYALGHFIHESIRALPEIADKAIPSVIDTAQRHGVQLPFSDYDSLKTLAFETVKNEVRYIGSFAKFARGATTHLVLLLAGCVVAMSLFLHPHFDTTRPAADTNLYQECCTAIAHRFATLYRGFVTVMGAQVIISAVNTVLTAIFVLATHLPYGVVIVGVSFLCGMIPVVGNLISNTIIVGVGFTVSPTMALVALIFLIAIHKLEYFLNSKIVGWRIHNPLWLTLLALVVGERLLGVPGMILAPVILNYIKLEASAIKPTTGPLAASSAVLIVPGPQG